jgi:hypothetical protein
MKFSIKSILGVCSALFLVGTANAIGFYGNQSDIKWKTAGTEHFQFIYPVEYSTHAAKVSTYAEAVYDSVTSRYNKPLPRISAVLNNALYSNGSAIPSENALNLWLTNWDFKIRSSHGWISDVVTHEFSHLVSIESGAKIVPNLYGFQFSYTDYYNERTRSDFLTMIPFTLQPLWLAEGTAQYESSRMGFDAWDTHRDMLLRTAALNDSLMTLPYMHDFSDNSLLAELGPYTQGFSLVLYIAKHYGDDAIPKIWKELGKPYRATLNGAIKSVLGISEQQLYDDWKKEITEYYQAQKDSLGTLVEGIKITKDAFWQDFPVVSGKNLYGISNFGGPWFDGSVFKIPMEDTLKTSDSTAKIVDSSSTDSTKVEVGDIEVEGADSNLINIADFAKSGFRAKKPWFDKGIDVYDDSVHGPILTYISYENRDKDGHAHFDVAVSDTNKNHTTLTYLTDAVYPSFNKQGTAIVFVRREPFSTRFVLSKVPFNSDIKNITAEDPIDIFKPDSSQLYYNIYSPKFSPDGKRIAFSFFDDVQRGIAIVDTNGANFKVVSTAGYDERDVNWIDNDKIIFASNRNNIFNLIEKDLNSGKERALTNVVGGAFTPTLAGDTIFFTQYDKDGFSLYKLPYAKKSEPVFRDSIIVSVRDSVLQFTDTLYVACADTAKTADSTKTANVASNVADTAKCTEEVLRKDVIQVEHRDTIKVAVTDSTQREIILHGTLPQKPHKELELIDREFAGTERNYKPIPNIPLFVPIFSISENAPSMTVFGEGEIKAKLGLAVVISDALKKNTVQLGLLLELGKGIDYINGDGLNPKIEKEFFIAWDNRSTPIDLGLSYSYANYTNKDTLRVEDVGANGGDSIKTSKYSYATQAITGTAGYSIFKSIDTLQAAISYDWSNVNFYDDTIEWTYNKRFSATVGFGLFGDQEGEGGSGISGQGNGLFAYYQYANSDLSRPGTLYVTENGKIATHYRNFALHQFGLNLYGSVQTPLLHARLAAGGKISSIFSWNTDDVSDTLDSYYYNPVFLDGYPYLRSNEDYTLSGTKTAMAELHYLYPIYDDWRHNLWIFSTRSLYVDLFAQIGAAWNGDFFTNKFTKHEFWDRSVGLSFRMSNKIWGSIPFDISLTFARGLSRIGEDKDLRGGRKLTPIELPLLHRDICPTRIKFSIGMGFANSWQ